MRPKLIRGLSILLCLFVLAEVNYPQLLPQSALAIFALFGLVLAFLIFPIHRKLADKRWAPWVDGSLATLAALVCGYVVVQGEKVFEPLWLGGRALGDRAGVETSLDLLVGAVGVLVVLEAARRTVGLALPLLSIAFLAYGMLGPELPSWLFPHRGYGVERLVSQSFLHAQGVFSVALRVMFTYVFLFVVFGALLEATGATRFIIDGTRRLLGRSAGGPAKVSILSSGLMGSLSGSAVANTATTGTFTIPLMRSAGFRPHIAGGIEAAASSGGALVPPVMGAGAYMMLEIVQPPVTYLEIVRAALLPAILYYLSLFLSVHFWARKLDAQATARAQKASSEDAAADADSNSKESDGNSAQASDPPPRPGALEGVIFLGSLGGLVALLLMGYTVFRAVSLAMVIAVGVAATSPRTRLSLRRLLDAFEKAAKGGIALVAASASVGIVLGVVTLTGVGAKLPATILPLAQDSLLLALLLIMASSIVLGMGLPSAVCYLLLATLISPVLGDLGVVPLAAHLFIFYFGLMSMVTPPVALAAYTAASIADSPIMRTGLAAFRFALIGFVLPFVFVYRPELLMLAPSGELAPVLDIALAFALVAIALVPLAIAITGFWSRPLGTLPRLLFAVAAVGLLSPVDLGFFPSLPLALPNLLGGALLIALVVFFRPREAGPAVVDGSRSGLA